jgi:hypothetical protein
MKSSRKLKETDKKMIAASQLWKCKKCEKILTSSYQIDHIIPFSVSADDSYDNLQALCPNCHCSKSQRENIRILQYKKLTALEKKTVCWFCTKEISSYHICNKILVDIIVPKQKELKIIDEFDKFIYIQEEEQEELIKKVSNLSLNEKNILKIQLLPSVVVVNNYFSDFINVPEYSVERICKVIETAMSFQKEKILYSIIEIDLSKMNPYGENTVPDELIEHLDIYMKKCLPKHFFVSEENIEYLYIA